MPRRPSSTPPPSTRRRGHEARRTVERGEKDIRWVLAASAIGLVIVALISGTAWYVLTGPTRLLHRAEAASRAGDWPRALAAWREVNSSPKARGETFLAEARAALALGRAAEAETALEKAVKADPSDPEPWRLRLEVLRVEDNPLKAKDVGWAAYAAVPPAERQAVLRELTLALLADLPDDLARRTLTRWATADPSGSDVDARVALLQRYAAMPRSGDPDRLARVGELSALLNAQPDHTSVREALVVTLAEVGDPERGRNVLAAWPEPERDARYWRLRGRWDLEYDHDYEAAIEAFHRVLAELPHDWKTRVRLARALKHLDRDADAEAEANTVARLRELLDPSILGPRLARDLNPSRLDDPTGPNDLADLCAKAGLNRLAEAWRREARARPLRNAKHPG